MFWIKMQTCFCFFSSTMTNSPTVTTPAKNIWLWYPCVLFLTLWDYSSPSKYPIHYNLTMRVSGSTDSSVLQVGEQMTNPKER